MRHEPPPSPSQPIDGTRCRLATEALAKLHAFSFTTDPSGRILWMSDGLAGLCGDRQDVVGREWTELLLLTSGTAPSSVHRELLTRCGQDALRLQLEPTPGASAAFDVRAIPFEDEAIDDEAGERSLAFVLRPAECKHSASGTQIGRGLLHGVLDALPDAVIAIDASGHVFFANHAAAELLGKSAGELQNAPIALALPAGASLREVAAGLALDEGSCELELPAPDGTARRVQLSVRSLSVPDAVRCKVLTLRELAPDLERSQLERKVSELESYVHSVSHDLRSPLVSMLGFTRLLQQDYESVLDETGRHFLSRIDQAGHTMDALIQDLLEISRIGGPDETRDLVDPRSVLLQLSAELKPRLEEEGVTLKVPKAPPLLLCDRTRLYQLFSNLIGNALTHMGPCEDPTICVEIEEQAELHHITIADNGRGIAPESHERVLQMFQTLDGRAESGGDSTGMGLAIVKKIAETHAGRVWIESDVGQGCRFHLTLGR